MKLSVTTNHKLTFQVYSCWSEEGGMGEDSYGPWVDHIEDAVTQLQLARTAHPKETWFIRCEVETTNSSKS